MARIEVYIDFRKYTSHIELVRDLSPALTATCHDEIHFTININAYSLLYADMLTLVASCIVHLRAGGAAVSGNFEEFRKDSRQAKYASRIDFFRAVGSDYAEKFQRRPSDGSFIEIKRFNDIAADPSFYINIHTEIIRILFNGNASREMMFMFDSCLTEIMDNALRHSTLQHGWASAQLFPKRREIRFIVADTGIGVHESLTQSPGTKYGDLSESEALQRSIQKGVTKGDGAGNGLYITSEFVKANAGQMLLYSGNHYLLCDGNGATVKEGPYWRGTFLFFKINTDIAVDFKEILGAHSTRDSDFEWMVDQYINVDDKLW